MNEDLEQLKKKLLKEQITTSEMKIQAIDEALENGTIDKKLDIILADIRERELEKKSVNEVKLKYGLPVD